jgi:hypothetical protein
LAEQGIQISAIDPKHQDLPKTHRDFGRSVTDLSHALAAEIDLWTVCCPTTDHMPVLRAILERNPHARVLVEKPACQGHEVEQFAALLATHRNARVLVNDQYLHSQALPRLTRAVADYEPQAALDLIGITFTKDRGNDIAQGRFIDRTYGVLGYGDREKPGEAVRVDQLLRCGGSRRSVALVTAARSISGDNGPLSGVGRMPRCPPHPPDPRASASTSCASCCTASAR